MPIHIVHTALVDEQHLFRSALPTFFVGTVRPPRSVSPPQYTSYSTIDNDVVSGYSWSMRRFGGRYSLTQLHARAMRRLAASWRLFRITRATALSNLWEDREIPSLHPGINFHEIHHPPGSRASEPFVSKLLSTIYIRNLAQCIPLHSSNTRSEKHRPTCNTNASKQEVGRRRTKYSFFVIRLLIAIVLIFPQKVPKTRSPLPKYRTPFLHTHMFRVGPICRGPMRNCAHTNDL